MTTKSRFELLTPLNLAGLFVIAGLAVSGQASATPTFVDGTFVDNQAICTSNGSGVIGAKSRAGYVVDPVAGLPKLNQVTYIHAVVTNLNPCAGDVVGFEFFLPPGATFAVSPTNPVQCFIGNGVTSGAAPYCYQQPSVGNNGGPWFGYQPGLAPGWSFEIQVPVMFTQALAGQSLHVMTTSTWGTKDSYVALTVPFVAPPVQQPPPPYGARGDDLALLGSGLAGSTLPVALSNDNGNFTVIGYPAGDFPAWSTLPGVKRLSGDFNNDGLTDFALVGGPGWNTIPVATSNGNGQFTITNQYVGVDFNAWARTANVTALPADFNHDGFTDIALVGGTGWGSVPVAFNTGYGNFSIANTYLGSFGGWAATPGARPLVGDFNKDGFADIALVGGAGWTTLPVAFSYGNGNFQITNAGVSAIASTPGSSNPWIEPSTYWWNFATSSQAAKVQAVTGDFNKDGYTDIALVGGASWSTIKLALSFGNGTFALIDKPVPNFPAWAASPGAKVFAADFNHDGYTDLALTGVAGWGSIPVAFSTGNGNFAVTNGNVGSFGGWASTPGVRIVAGDYNGDGYTDFALTGPNWSTIPVAFNTGYGNFFVTNNSVTSFPTWATDSTASVFTGHVD